MGQQKSPEKNGHRRCINRPLRLRGREKVRKSVINFHGILKEDYERGDEIKLLKVQKGVKFFLKRPR